MLFALDTPSVQTLKAEARALRAERATASTPLSHSAALEAVAQAHGYRDWNTAAAVLPNGAPVPIQVGQRVRGTYLHQAFTGVMLGVQLLADGQHAKVTIRFDQPVDVVTSQLFSAFRQRITATVDAHGVSPARTGDGQPQLRFSRA